ncbi:hypothetical protein [Streptomyces sp. SID3212]|uniref:hypothetical protein n=1 Tax=Streptomyces sp. SID3212 TaxID=2690259 RepID=UPI001368BF7D|nr:hypothetical protein [Streptomyces sp. SID3212]MYV56677.1 hypothetical protein [Streptomyces sp. SID3212]
MRLVEIAAPVQRAAIMRGWSTASCFFLAADDETAAATRLRGPGAAFESVSCHFIDPDTSIAEWDMYELEEFAGRWTARLGSEDGDGTTDDDLLAVLQKVARLAASAVNTGGGLYSWSF